MELTGEQKYENYLTLQRSIQNLRSGAQVTPEWNDHHLKFFTRVRAFFKNFNDVLMDDDSEELRKKCSELEVLAQYNEQFIARNTFIDYSAYRLFLDRLLYIAEYTMGDDEITDLMEKLGM